MTISAKIVVDSIHSGVRLSTLQIKAPKFLDAEFEKHRMLSSNSSSDRAIPFLKMLDKGYFLPNDVRLNQPGMQGDLLLDEDSKEEFWNDLKDVYDYTANKLKAWDKVHKQHLNRYLMGFSWQHKVVTATEWENFFNLRLDKAADPAMYELAKCMKEAMENSIPKELGKSEWIVNNWHLPYVNVDKEEFGLEPDIAVKCSVARCARVSYLNHDNTTPDIEKDIALYGKLLEAGHMSPFEHVATPMRQGSFNVHAEEGITHIDKYDNLWSGNFRGWIQYRQLLLGNTI